MSFLAASQKKEPVTEYRPQGSELLSGQQALSTLSDNGLCAIYLVIIFAAATLAVALPRTLGQLSWLGLMSATLIFLCGILAMIGAGRNPTPNRVIQATVSTNFYQAFLAITGPVSLLSSTQMDFSA